MESLKEIFNQIKESLSIPLMNIGNAQVTLWTILYFIVFVIILLYITAKLRKWIIYKLLAKSSIDIGVRVAVGTIIRYLILIIGFIIVLQTVGIDLSTLTILAGALGVGIGFGLQNITNNLVSGIIILFERPIKVGDRIEVGNISGDVIKISIRATTILTNDSALIFNLRVWTSNYIHRPGVLKSQLYYSIFEKFKKHGVEIPFPQRDIHFKSGILPSLNQSGEI